MSHLSKITRLLATVAVVGGLAVSAYAASGARGGSDDAPAEEGKPAAGKPLPKEQLLKRGMAAAPTAVAVAGIKGCTPESAIELGKTPDKSTAYEIDCAGDAGYLVILSADQKTATATSCVESKAMGAACALPGNANAHKVLTPVMATAGRTCDVSQAVYRGQNPKDGERFVEVACTGQKMSYVVGLPKTGTPRALDCLQSRAMGLACQLTPAAAVDAAQLTIYQGILDRAGKSFCKVSKGRIIGISNAARETIYEFGCSNQASGWVIGSSDDGSKKPRVFDCLAAQTVFRATCEYTKPEALNAGYTSFLKSKGIACTVNGATVRGVSASGNEIREYTCTGKKGYMVIMNPDKASAKEIKACAEAKNIGGGCTMAANKL